MKICLITKECFPFYYGGIGSTFYSFGNLLAGLGHEVVLLSKQPSNIDESLLNSHYSQGFSVEWVDYSPGIFSPHFMLDYAFQLEKYFERFSEQFNPEVVIFPEYDGEAFFLVKEKIESKKYPGITFIIHYSGPLFLLYNSVNKKAGLYEDIIFQMEEFCIKNSINSIAPSSFISNLLLERFKLDYQLTSILPNPVNPKVFSEPTVVEKSIETRQRNILFVGRLQDIKGADILVDAFNLLVTDLDKTDLDLRLQMIGDNLYWESYQQTFVDHWRHRLPENIFSKIQFSGYLPHSEILQSLKNAWIAVFPSRFETFGNVAMEAIYCSTPVLANFKVGLEAVLGKKYGLYWQDDEGAEGLMKKLKEVILNPNLREDLREASANRANELHKLIRNSLVDIVRRFVKSNKNRMKNFQLKHNTDKLFYLSNEFASHKINEKNAEIHEVYVTKDGQLKDAWAEYDKKNDEIRALIDKHDQVIKEVWSKYDEQTNGIREAWKMHDEKNRLLEDLNQALIKLSEGFPVSEINSTEKWPAIELIFNQVDSIHQKYKAEIDELKSGAENQRKELEEEIRKNKEDLANSRLINISQEERLSLLWKDLEKERNQFFELKSNMEQLKNIIGEKDKTIRDISEVIIQLQNEIDATKSSDIYIIGQRLQKRKLVWSILKRLF